MSTVSAENRFEFTIEAVRTRCVPPAPGEVNGKGKPVVQKIYWDSKLRGFGLLVGQSAKTFIAQRDFGGRTIRRKLDRYPTITVQQARERAREELVKIGKGVDSLTERRERVERQRKQEWETFTLRQAMETHAANMRAKGCVPRSIHQMEDEFRRMLPDWLDKPLVALRRKDCIERHRHLTTSNGPVVANRVLRMVRACWNSGRRLYEDLPEHAVAGVVFNKQSRRRQPIPWADLPGWWAKVRGLSNPARRDLNLLMLFTGLRATDACTVRWEHLDFAQGTLHRPKPKGGTDRAFTVPVAAFVLRVLARRRASNAMMFPEGDGGWVFPTRDRKGNVVPTQEPKEQRFAYSTDGTITKTFHLPSPHRLRDTFATACLEAGVGHTETKILMNHSLPNSDVTVGYQRPSTDHLRWCAEKVAAFLLKAKRVARSSRTARKVGA